jgi:3',5'-cyclic AMP phosphodiesterase CpdA
MHSLCARLTSLRIRDWVAVSSVAALIVTLGVVTSSTSARATHGPDVRISEVANGGPSGLTDGTGSTDNFFEITNYGDEVADLDGWRVYRCVVSGSRVAARAQPLVGVQLDPGERYVFAHRDSTVAHADARYTWSFVDVGFGVRIEDENEQVVDGVAVYPAPMDSECDMGGPTLPNVLNFKDAQSYQRIGLTGDATDDFIIAERTPGAPNATEPHPGVQHTDVLISELTNGGVGGGFDNFIELSNYGEQPVDISGWSIYRCDRDGRLGTGNLQVTIPTGTMIEPGGVFVAARPEVEVPEDVPHIRYETTLDNLGFGVLIENADGVVVEAVGVYESDNIHQPAMDSPCAQGRPLPNRLDYGFDETYQRVQNTGDNAADFVKSTRTIGDVVTPEPIEEVPLEFGPVRISELTHSGPAGLIDNFFELANYGDVPISLDGWSIDRCRADGRRTPEPLVPAIDSVVLDPGQTFLAVRSGSPLHLAGDYDLTYSPSFSNEGFGLIVYDADGEVVDKVGSYDGGGEGRGLGAPTYSACTLGLAPMNVLDTNDGFSYQRVLSTGVNAQDFVAAPRTPGELPGDLRPYADFSPQDLEPVDVAPDPRPLPPTQEHPDNGVVGLDPEVELRATARHTAGDDAEVVFHGARQIPIVEQATRIYTGSSKAAPLTERRPDGEQPQPGKPPDGTGEPLVAESVDEFPYQRYELVVPELGDDGLDVYWQGRSAGRNEVQLYAWNHHADRWELLDAGGGVVGGEITLIGTIDADSMVRGRTIDLLVQDGPATREAFSDEASEPNHAFKDPDEYDLAFGFVADTQFLAESFRYSYAEINRWLVTNQDARKIAYSFHVGDVIQTWINGTDSEARARDEFAFASAVMEILEKADHPYGVTPGNHDNKWGRENELYNEYFPTSRFDGFPWWGGSWRENDSTHHYNVMEIGGAKFLMMYLGYYAADEAIEWANEVIARHPDHNVIFATHEYINAAGELTSPGRWTAQGQQFFDEIVLPNDNVFLVLAGHFHGVALNIKRDVGGVDGRIVVEMLANYSLFQDDGLRDTGFLRLLQVDVDAKKMAVNTYSPWLDKHNAWEHDTADRYTADDDEFTIDIDINDIYDKRVETDAIGLQRPAERIGSVSVGDGETASVNWVGLRPGTAYSWYVTAVDSGANATSPVRTFTTGN